MRLSFLALVGCLLFGCYEDKAKENPTTCEVKEVEEGLFFRCVDKDGKESSGLVKNGEKGPQGEKGEGLRLVSTIECSGQIEGWMPQASYVVKYHHYMFETESMFQSATIDLMRGGEKINSYEGSSFYVSHQEMEPLEIGIFQLDLKDKKLVVKRESGEQSTLACLEK